MDTTRNLFWVGICHPMVPVGTMWGGRDCRVQKLFCYIWKMVMATEELFHYLLSSKRDGRVGMELTRMADGHPIITQQLFGRFWCGLRESSAMPAQQTRRWILPFLPLQLQVIYCTRGYREDVYNRGWNQPSHQLQLWSRAVHLGDQKKENSSSPLLGYVTWLLTPWKKTSSRSVLCFSLSLACLYV